jgi:hypothetical protein
MEHLNQAILLSRLGLFTEALGPPEEWAPMDKRGHQIRHAQFWSLVGDILPEDEHDEEHWMTLDAADQLRDN